MLRDYSIVLFLKNILPSELDIMRLIQKSNLEYTMIYQMMDLIGVVMLFYIRLKTMPKNSLMVMINPIMYGTLQ